MLPAHIRSHSSSTSLPSAPHRGIPLKAERSPNLPVRAVRSPSLLREPTAGASPAPKGGVRPQKAPRNVYTPNERQAWGQKGSKAGGEGRSIFIWAGTNQSNTKHDCHSNKMLLFNIVYHQQIHSYTRLNNARIHLKIFKLNSQSRAYFQEAHNDITSLTHPAPYRADLSYLSSQIPGRMFPSSLGPQSHKILCTRSFLIKKKKESCANKSVICILKNRGPKSIKW